LLGRSCRRGSSGLQSGWACRRRVRTSAGAEKTSYGLHPEKTWNSAEGRGFDSRQLHHVMTSDTGHGSVSFRPPARLSLTVRGVRASLHTEGGQSVPLVVKQEAW